MNHDFHCLVTFMGVNWRITKMKGLGWIELRALDDPAMRTVLDLSEADLGRYCETAVQWQEPLMATENVHGQG